MFKKVKEKPVIIAICGKSASGKTSLAKYFTNYLLNLNLPAHMMIGMTTRPKRSEEIDEVDYYFVNKEEFKEAVFSGKLIDHDVFRGWSYGIQLKEVYPRYINIGVFSPAGIKKLRRYRYKYIVIPVYLEEDFQIRSKRMRQREHKWHPEYIRRLIVDWKDFIGIKTYIDDYFMDGVHLKNTVDVEVQGNEIFQKLLQLNIVKSDLKNEEVRLGKIA